MNRFGAMLAAALLGCGVAGSARGANEKAAPQSGLPAKLEAVTGKKARVFLQRMEDGKVVFQPYRSTRELAVPPDKIKHLEFVLKYDADGVAKAYREGDYAQVVSTLGPLLQPYAPYMGIDNNLRDAFATLMVAYREAGELDKARKAAEALVASGDPSLELLGRVVLVQAALADGDIATAEKLRAEIESQSAGLYLDACIQRAKGQPKEAIQTAAKVISDFGNDMQWLPPTELLCAELYLDMAMTNSASHTARQVEHIYAGTHIAADAARLRAPLLAAEEEAQASETNEVETAEGAQTNATETVQGSETNEAEAVQSLETNETEAVQGSETNAAAQS